jgi:putative redox protein
MTDEKTIHAHVIETGESTYSVAIEVSGHSLKGDESADSGGKNLGPAPYDVLLAALGECTAMTVRWYAVQQKWPLEKVEVKLTHHKENKTDIFTKEVLVYGSSLSEEQHRKLIEVAGKCPVQRTLEGTPVIRTITT